MNVITKIATVALAASFLFPAYAEKNNESDKLDFTSERTAEKSLLFDREKGEEILRNFEILVDLVLLLIFLKI